MPKPTPRSRPAAGQEHPTGPCVYPQENRTLSSWGGQNIRECNRLALVDDGGARRQETTPRYQQRRRLGDGGDALHEPPVRKMEAWFDMKLLTNISS